MAILLSIISGCASTPSQPFQTFQESLNELRIGTDKALANLVPETEGRFKRQLIDELENGETTLLESLQISTSQNKPFALKDAPLFLKVEKFRLGANEATASLGAYAALLVQLTDPNFISKDKIKNIAENLNANATEAIIAMNTDPNEDSSQNVALFSLAAAEAFEGYLNFTRKKALIDILEENQLNIEQYSQKMQNAVKIMAYSAYNEYTDKYQQTYRKAINPNTRTKGIDELISLAKDYSEQVKIFQALNEAYGQIPVAHAGLKETVQTSGKGLKSIVALLENAEGLQKRYDQTIRLNKAAALQSKADVSAAKADELTSRAKLALLESKIAEADALEARSAASNDPTNSDKVEIAKNLSETARIKKEEADKLIEQAKSYKAASENIQDEVDDIKTSLTN